MSLGVDRSHFREYFKDGGGILRCSLYRPCDNSNLSIAKGPHSDPVCITILHQDQDAGLEVLMDNKWLVCQRRPEAFVVNLGDTFQEHERRSLAYFVVPNRDKTIYYTADTETLNRFLEWLPSKDSVPTAEDA
ncbi:gibberellin 20 oxidase 2-like [Prosopis cineraria]|uniref:gibberellin 20 oxidase 2-like n=1 Tax=Prosopis cineraria TaxID=364024 RepID=UPI00240F71DA|nr:gibberellin 20 oxidase 2-like [Prosopis cineraria]